MSSRSTLWLLISTLIVFVVWSTSCGPATGEIMTPAATEVATEAPASNIYPPPLEGNFNCEQGDNMVCTIGENQEVVVIIPWQPEHGSFLYAVGLPIGGDVSEFRNKDRDEFQPYGIAVNLELVLDPSESGEYVNIFNPPIRVGARYTEADVKTVGEANKIQLGFWDETNNYWVSFAQHEKYEYSLEPIDDFNGYICVTIQSWGDRRIGFDG